jgi:cyclic pyranopterin phosphate synthase
MAEDPPPLTHLDATGQAHMVDVSAKKPSHRRAVARATVRLGAAFDAWRAGTLAKGDAAAVVRIAGIQAAKRTAELIPLAHPIPITRVTVELTSRPDARAVDIRAAAETVAVTGVEMEAMTAASVAGLTLYDMVKSVARDARIDGVELVEKSGGRSGPWRRD